MIADLLNIEITDLAVLESQPFGAIVIGDGAPYQRIIDGDWYVAGSDIGTTAAKLIRCKSLHLVWLPPEASR